MSMNQGEKFVKEKNAEKEKKMQVYALQWYMKTKLFLIGENRSEMW